MAERYWSGEKSRRITSRIVIEGDLILLTPAHLGNGEGATVDELVDMTLLLDPLAEGEGRERPLLTGTTIAGALRSYLREREHGFGGRAEAASLSSLLFGGQKGDNDGEQSRLIVDDAISAQCGIELRDGVSLEGKTRTAAEKAKFDLQLWEAGTIFPLRFELIIDPEVDPKPDSPNIRQALTTALAGLTNGEITIGARKQRGYGRVTVRNWRLREYDLKRVNDLLSWIRDGGASLCDADSITTEDLTARLGGVITDHRNQLAVSAVFSLNSSLLIRAGGGKSDQGPDMAHLQSRQADGRMAPVLSGTSLAGAIRNRVETIINTLAPQKTTNIIKNLFGDTGQASRLMVSEQPIENGVNNLVQNRVAIDRFTGGARETALFNQQPVFGDEETHLTINLRLINPADHEIGLILLALKDLWTGDLPLGGEQSVGRGRLKGRHATINLRQAGEVTTWKMCEGDQGLQIDGEAAQLENYVSAALPEYLHGTRI
jgi:CRISPR/Cas system CSM-associated protein Csm3 (group 7 of RAMP superfamily)